MERFIRTELLLHRSGMEKLSQSKVAIFGIGGVGSYVAEALARTGVGNVILIDYDTICLSNINRQLHALTSTIGLAKVNAMAERIREINPNCQVTSIKEFYNENTRDELVSAEYSYIVDAIDSMAPKVDLIATALSRSIPIISSMGAGNKLDPTMFKVVDISKTHTCPMAKAVRKQLKERGITSGLQVVFSTETPRSPLPAPESEISTKRQIPGSVSFVPSVAGLIMASVVVNNLVEGKR